MKKIHTLTIIASLMAVAAQAATVVYQSNFDTATNLASAGLESVGASGGLWDIDTGNDRLKVNFPGGGDRATVNNTGGWQSDDGFTLDVTFNQVTASSKFSIGLVDASGNWNNGDDFIQDSHNTKPYSIGFSTDGALEDANGNKDVLSFYNGSTVSKLSDAQGDITVNEDTRLILTITADSWSYSLNGAPATIGSGSFDMDKSYMFVAYQNNPRFSGSYISNITLTAIPEPGTYALLGGLLALGYVMVRRRR
jgi:hypothetical protein